MQYLFVQEGDQIRTNRWEFFYNTIYGFDYEEGFLYDLDVKIDEIKIPPPMPPHFVMNCLNSLKNLDPRCAADGFLLLQGQLLLPPLHK